MEQINSISNQYINSYKKVDKREVSTKFKESVSNASNESMIKNLGEKYDVNISVQSVPKNCTVSTSSNFMQGSSSSSGIGLPVVIDPKLVEKLKTDPKLRNDVENKIKSYNESYPRDKAYLAANDIVLDGTVLIFHEDGTWEEWGFSHTSPKKEEECRELNAKKEKEKLEKKLYYKKIMEDSMNQNLEVPFNIQTMPNPVYNPVSCETMGNLFPLQLNTTNYLNNYKKSSNFI